MTESTEYIGSSPIQSSLDGKIQWQQGPGKMDIESPKIAIRPTDQGGGPNDIQKAIDALAAHGGTVVMKNGTYLLENDLVLPDNITLSGESAGATIIDFQGEAYQVIVSGSLVSSTGTCAVNNKSSTVVGTGTAWDTDLIGENILLKGRWFEIIDVADTTHLTIGQPFDADSISGQSNVIAAIISGVTLLNFTVQNSTHSNGAVYFAYALSCTLDGVTVYDSTIGANFLAANAQNARNFTCYGCGTGAKVLNSAVWTMYNFYLYGSAGVNLLCNNFFNTSVSNATISSAVGNNATLTNCEAWGFYDMENTSAGACGIEMIDCTDMEIFAMSIRASGSDGIKLTSGCLSNVINMVTMINNTGFGLNIADSSSDKNTVTSSSFKSNTGGTIQNNGTNTINANNQT